MSDRCGSGKSAGRGREGDEKGVPLRIDLHAALGRAGCPHNLSVLDQRVRVGLGPELVEKPRRALDIGE